jgi:PAS domain-containing protein/anti-sigma regulatory factor (Ser/Thr protein kinase)
VPLINEEGFGLGTLCVIDNQKRTLTTAQQTALKVVARQVMDKLELRRKVLELEKSNTLLQQSELRIYELNKNLIFSNTRAKTLVQQAPVAIIVFRGDNLLIEDVNAAMLNLLGKDAEILNKPLLQAIPELEGQQPYELLCNVYATGKPYYGYEAPAMLNRNGKQEIGYYNYTYSPLREDGKITGIINMGVEVTEQVVNRKRIEENYKEQAATNEKLVAAIEKLKTTEETLQLAISSAALGTWRVEASANKLHFSRRSKELFGLPLDEEPSIADVINAIDPAYRLINIRAVKNGLAHQTPSDITYSVNNKVTGKQVWIRAFGRASVDPNNKTKLFSGIVMDITEQVKDDQRKNDFIAMVSHELKTPLASLGGYIQMVQRTINEKGDPFAYGVLEKARKQANKMNILIEGFLNVSRLESGKIQIDKQLFDMAALMKEMEEESIAMISTHKVVFAPVEYTVVQADRNKIGQVIHNLISNAVKYSPRGSTINVACITTRDNYALVSIKDEGVGIALGDQQEIFSRYYRVEGNSMQTASGFGIGLYLCAEIIQRHEGKIWVESEVGKGSILYFSLPID